VIILKEFDILILQMVVAILELLNFAEHLLMEFCKASC
jgi:hypothetical protein